MKPQAGDIWQFDSWDSNEYYLYLEYQGLEHGEQKWLALQLDTGEINSVLWWQSDLFKKVA